VPRGLSLTLRPLSLPTTFAAAYAPERGHIRHRRGELYPMLDTEEARTAAQSRVREALHNVYDPELGVNVVDLGLIYDIDVREDGQVFITMTLTTPGCPMHESIGEGVSAALQTLPDITGGEIRIVWEPPWEPSMMTEEGKRELGWGW
jgi:metal-sulfur cluster biosynthetic enzyme